MAKSANEIQRIATEVAAQLAATTPSWSNASDVMTWKSGNNATNKPTLVVTYTTVVGPANLKSYNTNLSANIKSINTNLIANVKSLDTNV